MPKLNTTIHASNDVMVAYSPYCSLPRYARASATVARLANIPTPRVSKVLTALSTILRWRSLERPSGVAVSKGFNRATELICLALENKERIGFVSFSIIIRYDSLQMVV